MSESEVRRHEHVASILDAVRHSAQELMAGVPTRPSTLRVQAGEVAVELEWTAAEPFSSIETATLPRDVLLGPVDAGADLLHDICAPTVGVFYRSPEPGQPAFVEEGDLVELGQQVAVLEAMKIMMPVEADMSGRIFAVMKPNGVQVEYGEPLFSIEPVG